MTDMKETPTTREVLQELYEELEKKYNEARDVAYNRGKLNESAEGRAVGLNLAMAMIVGIENKYGI